MLHCFISPSNLQLNLKILYRLNLLNTISKLHVTVMLLIADSQFHIECASMSVSYFNIQFHMSCSNSSSVITIKMKAKANLYTTAMLLLFIVHKLHIFSMIWVSRNRTPSYNTVLIGNTCLTLTVHTVTCINEPIWSQVWWLPVFHFTFDADFSRLLWILPHQVSVWLGLGSMKYM